MGGGGRKERQINEGIKRTPKYFFVQTIPGGCLGEREKVKDKLKHWRMTFPIPFIYDMYVAPMFYVAVGIQPHLGGGGV